MGSGSVGKVGIFWFLQWQGHIRLLSASCTLAEGEPYGEMITYGSGHYSTWCNWQTSKSSPLIRGITKAYEYEQWPRGRVSYCLTTQHYLLLCDIKIMQKDLLELIVTSFELPANQINIDGDPHYRSVENLN